MSGVTPTLASLLRRTARLVVPPAVRNHLLRAPRWSIAVFEGDDPTALRLRNDSSGPVITRDDVTDVDAAFVADPFAVCRDGTWHLFFEVLNRTSGRGEIGLATSDDLRHWTYHKIVLAEPFHLSYPYTFEHDGNVYMVPEAGASGGVRLYRATQFPYEWVLESVLLTGPVLLDATVFAHDDRWWLFTDTSHRHTHDTLRLYQAPSPLGPWSEHPASPVVTGDAAGARPAGRVVHTGDRLIRFAQDCSVRYGRQARAYEITHLTPTSYADRPVGVVVGPGTASWNARAMHHVDAHQLDDRWIAFVDGS